MTDATAATTPSLLDGLNPQQRRAVECPARLLGVVAGAGSGKTEVMARRVAWWVQSGEVERSKIVAFTFTEAAAEELKFRIRAKLQQISGEADGGNLNGMYIGTIHAFCLKCLKEFAAQEYYNFDVVDDVGRMAVIQQGFFNVLAMGAFVAQARNANVASGVYNAVNLFTRTYDILNEHIALTFDGPASLPARIEDEREFCSAYTCTTPLGSSELHQAFAVSAARYYAYLRARRFLDFSTAQAEFVRKLRDDEVFRNKVHETFSHVVVDEVQDINPAQSAIVQSFVERNGTLTAVGDHRQAIYAFRGGRVDLMGSLFSEIESASDGVIENLPANYRSTHKIIDVANAWARTIGQTEGLSSPDMTPGVEDRTDSNQQHVAISVFNDRPDEAVWIANTIAQLVPDSDPPLGARHGDGQRVRGISYSDVAVLVRSSTDIATYKDALRALGIPAVVRGGPDLFSQPEVLAFLSALCLASGDDAFMGGGQATSLPSRAAATLGTTGAHRDIIPAAFNIMRGRGLSLATNAATRLIDLSELIHARISTENRLSDSRIEHVTNPQARTWLRSRDKPRRLFPQTILQWLLEEAGFGDWGEVSDLEFETIRFHVGQLSSLLKGMESSGWTGAGQNFKYQLIGLIQWGTTGARTPEAPLLAAPNAVSITTIHSSKGLEFPAVFVADVCARRFPSQFARRAPTFAFDPSIVTDVQPGRLADNANLDGERRLMYVALTRAERFLFVTASGNQRSGFFAPLTSCFQQAGGRCDLAQPELNGTFDLLPRQQRRDLRLTTSFSDLRYFMECPQDFFMRKVLGFTPAIGQEFGYGRGVHNLLRAVHEDPQRWAELAQTPPSLKAAIEALVAQGLFYLRYTVGEPYERLRNKAVAGVVEYVKAYDEELGSLVFEPEKAFETLFPEEGVLVSGAIDVVRLDDPPRVTLIDFKSGDASGENSSGLSQEMMAMQLGVYGIAARRELEYEPGQGFVRYIGERDAARRQVEVSLSNDELTAVRQRVVETARQIRDRRFGSGPATHLRNRCGSCDFQRICPLEAARRSRRS